MTATQASQPVRLPATITLGGATVTLRAMTAQDRDPMVAFARRLPHDDLLFLRRDITAPSEVDRWIGAIEAGAVQTTLAVQDDAVVGYAMVDRGDLRWTRHLAEIRALVGPSLRSRGLGRALLQIAFDQAVASGAMKIVAQITVEQVAAAAIFTHLGFQEEAVLRHHVIDADGLPHDLRVLSVQVRDESLPRCDGCGTPSVTLMPFSGQALCFTCFEERYQELGG